MVNLSNNRYSYERFGSKGVRAGQAALDVLQNNPYQYTTEDIIDQFGRDYLNDIRECAQKEKDNFPKKFHIFSLLNKDLGQFGVSNVLRHWKIPRKTAPLPEKMMVDYRNHTKTLFKVDSQKGKIDLLWTLPGYDESKSILKNTKIHDPSLVKIIKDVFSKIHVSSPK